MLPGCWKSGDTDIQEEGKRLYVINVLEKNLYNDCHIKGSVNVPFEQVKTFAQKLNKDAHIVVYCSNYRCTASGSVVKMLGKMGFEHVWAYEGGTAEWYQNGLPVEGVCKQAYLQKVIEPAGHTANAVPIITAQELKQKMEEMAA